jgi:hypothetical protein
MVQEIHGITSYKTSDAIKKREGKELTDIRREGWIKYVKTRNSMNEEKISALRETRETKTGGIEV